METIPWWGFLIMLYFGSGFVLFVVGAVSGNDGIADFAADMVLFPIIGIPIIGFIVSVYVCGVALVVGVIWGLVQMILTLFGA
jgi:hypothetical protein